MPRKKNAAEGVAAPVANAETVTDVKEGSIEATAVASNASDATPPEQPAHWGKPYKSVFVAPSQGFEMGEDRRWKQRVFKFDERPADEVIAKLKEAGFSYRAHEKSWTVSATAETRVLSDRLAREFAGPAEGVAR